MPIRASIANRRRLRRLVIVVVALLVLIAASGIWSYQIRFTEPWWSALLANAAVVLFLLIPGQFFLTWFDSAIERIDEEAAETRTEVAAARATVETATKSLEAVREELMTRQQRELDDALNVYQQVLENLDREQLVAALRQATVTEVVTSKGVRSPVWNTDLHYRFVLDEDFAGLEIRLEHDDQTVISTHDWASGVDATTFFQSLVMAVRRAGYDLGTSLNDPTNSVEDLLNMLMDVTRLRSQELLGHRYTLRHIIERRQGWFFTEENVIPEEHLHYAIAVNRLREPDWEPHLRDKGWYTVTGALNFAYPLYGIKDPRPR